MRTLSGDEDALSTREAVVAEIPNRSPYDAGIKAGSSVACAE